MILLGTQVDCGVLGERSSSLCIYICNAMYFNLDSCCLYQVFDPCGDPGKNLHPALRVFHLGWMDIPPGKWSVGSQNHSHPMHETF